MAPISFDQVTKRFEGATTAVDALTLEIADGEVLVLVGPSGSGKTTALRLLAGLEPVSAGEIRIGRRRVNEVAPRDRDVAMVFQNYALYPHMSVRENMSFALRRARVPRDEVHRRVDQAAEMLGIAELLERRPRQLSGGQRQRVAMGRAIVREPQAFLMDEPLCNLDAKLRVEMRAYLAQLQRRLGTTTLYVTHDQSEAMTMGTRVAVMRAGRLEQVDTPQHLYARPANAFVAGFIGSPAMNLVPSRLVAEGGRVLAVLGDRRLLVPPEVLEARPGLARHLGRDVLLGVRPEDLEDARWALGRNGDHTFQAEVVLAEPMGAEVVAHVTLPGQRGPRLVARLNPRTSAGTGTAVSLAAAVEHLHFFDPHTQAAIW